MDIAGITLFKKYFVVDFIKKGGFGSIFSGKNIKNDQSVAIKREPASERFSILKHEVTILKYLYDHKIRNIPIVHWFGKHENFLYFIMPKYDCSLYEYIECKQISKAKIKSIIIQCISLLQSIHQLFLVHRDIKPQNIMVHNGELFLIDFGFSIFYIDENKHHYIDEQEEQSITGSPRFASYFIYEGFKPSRRDDLISIAYIYLYLVYKELPWDNIQLFQKQEPTIHIYSDYHQQIKELKSLEHILPRYQVIHPYMDNFITHLYELSYFQEPSYGFLIDLVKKINI